VAKSGPKSADGTAVGAETKARIVQAALQTLKEVGFSGASARAIAKRGGFNPALIFYHFGSVNDVLLAALDATSEQRMARYREAVEAAHDLPSLLGVAADVYREDLESGHITVLAEMIAGASTVPELGPEIVQRIEPWIRFTEDAASRVLSNTPFAGIAPPRDLAFGIVALYLGMELLTHLEKDRERAESLLTVAQNVTGLLGPLLEPAGGR
jgi:AcrR family transcriptional regulator